jgi:hexosaminidase
VEIMVGLIPKPASAVVGEGQFRLTAETDIYVEPGAEELIQIGEYLAARLNPATGFALEVVPADGPPAPGNFYLTTQDGEPALGEEGYLLMVRSERVSVVAQQPAGLFRAVQTLRQLLPAAIESATVQPGPWVIPAITIRDRPRFEWRGGMLDVARHFFGVEDIQRFIDRLAYYKLNRLHLHLTDDQGWRIMIESWPRLALHGGSTAVGGDPGGYLSLQDYAEIVAYAQRRYVVVVPEIDMPGHTNAALASYPELNCDGVAPPLYTGIEVGFSSLCVEREATFRLVDDVVRELAALTPGEYIHIGGDEAKATSEADYRHFIERVQGIVHSHDKRMVGWEEIAQADLLPTSVAQHWHSDLAATAVKRGAKVILSPASRAYLDMQYDPSTPLGLHWAGFVEVRDSYEWDPATQLAGVAEQDVLGVEAALWSETLRTLADVDYLAFPRLLGIAEIGWSPAAGRAWEEYRKRLAAHGPRLAALGVNFYRSPQVEWE